nr:MAG TPA: hypothetical protein [Caudoviricetes sp.]
MKIRFVLIPLLYHYFQFVFSVLCSPYRVVPYPSIIERRTPMYRNEHLIDKTVEITIAKLSNSSITPNADNGKDVAKFMQEIYNKLNELNKNSN